MSMLGRMAGGPFKAFLILGVVLGGAATGAYVAQNQEAVARHLARLSGRAADDVLEGQLRQPPLRVAEASGRAEDGVLVELRLSVQPRPGEQARLNATTVVVAHGGASARFEFGPGNPAPPGATGPGRASVAVLRDADGSTDELVLDGTDLVVITLPLQSLVPAPGPRAWLNVSFEAPQAKPLHVFAQVPGSLAPGLVPLELSASD